MSPCPFTMVPPSCLGGGYLQLASGRRGTRPASGTFHRPVFPAPNLFSVFLVHCAASLQNYDSIGFKSKSCHVCKSSGNHLCFDILAFACSC